MAPGVRSASDDGSSVGGAGWLGGGGGSVVGGDGYSVKADLAEVVARSWWGIPGLVWVKLFE